MSSQQEQIEQGLQLLEETQAYLRAVFLGIALQYRSLDLQKQELLCGTVCGPSPTEVQSSASLIILCALFGFLKQAQELANDEARAGLRPDLTDVQLSAVSITVALIRLVRLHLPEETTGIELQDDSALTEDAQALEDLPL